jgi:hypothetical protein
MLLGLCAALFGVMAFAASGAQAAKWLILDKTEKILKTAEELSPAVGGKIDVTPVLHTEVLKIKFLVSCTSFTTVGVKLEGSGKVTEGGKVKFSGCKGETNGSPNANCTPKSKGEAEGVVLTNEGKGQLVLHEVSAGVKVGLTKLEPKTGTTFATLEMKEACPVGEKLPVNGVLYLKDSAVETLSKEHLIEEGPLTHLYATNTDNAEHAATITGSGWVFLEGTAAGAEHEGLKWSGMPE